MVPVTVKLSTLKYVHLNYCECVGGDSSRYYSIFNHEHVYVSLVKILSVLQPMFRPVMCYFQLTVYPLF